VELIVLNVGLSAGILSTRTFSMFVLHALVLTFITTPLTIMFYPARLRTYAGAIDEKSRDGTAPEGHPPRNISDESPKTRFSVILDKVEQLPAVMTLTQLLRHPSAGLSPLDSESLVSVTENKISDIDTSLPGLVSIASRSQTISMSALRLIELTGRTSAVLKSQAADALVLSDPILSIFKTFGRLNKFLVSTSLSVVSHEEFPAAIAEHARENTSQMVILPWSSSSMSVAEESSGISGSVSPYNPFSSLFDKNISRDQASSIVYSQYIRKVFAVSPADVALYVDRGLPAVSSSGTYPHIFMPFFGGPDDRLALSFVVQLCANESVMATVVRITSCDDLTPISSYQEKTKTRIEESFVHHHSNVSPRFSASEFYAAQSLISFPEHDFP